MYMFVFCYKMNLHAALFTMTSVSLSGYQEEPQVTKITIIVTQHVAFVMIYFCQIIVAEKKSMDGCSLVWFVKTCFAC